MMFMMMCISVFDSDHRLLLGRPAVCKQVPPTAASPVSSVLEDKLFYSLHFQAHFVLGVGESWQHLKVKKCGKKNKYSASTWRLPRLIWNEKGLEVMSAHKCFLSLLFVTVAGFYTFISMLRILAPCVEVAFNVWRK